MIRFYSKDRERTFDLIVDWNLGNKCSYGCSYCSPHFHAGTNPFPALDDAKAFVDAIAKHYTGLNRTVRFSFIGGEPLLYEGLVDLCAHVRSHFFTSEIKTNGDAPLALWERLAPNLSSVVITKHPRLSYDHLLAVVGLLRSHGVTVFVTFACPPGEIARAHGHLMDLRERAAVAWADLQLLYEDHTRRTRLMDYAPEELALYQSTLPPPSDVHDIVVENEDGTVETLPFSFDAIRLGRNVFTGMGCRIGLDQIVVDQDGTIRRGWCRVGGVIGNVHTGEFEKPEEPVVCDRLRCSNPLDCATMKFAPGAD